MIKGKYKNEAFNKLKSDCIKYMSPQRDWHYPKADMYLLYSLKQAPPYSCSAPFWREIREEIFTELRQVVNKPTIYYLALVTHSEKSIALPIGNECPDMYGFFFLESKEADIINSNVKQDMHAYISACKDLGITHPHLVNWFERDKRWHRAEDNTAYLAGNKFYSTVLPKNGTTYFHVEFRND